MNDNERRLSGMAYLDNWELDQLRLRAKRAIRAYNEAVPFDRARGRECLDEAGIVHGRRVHFEPPFYCEYGNIETGEGFYANTGCVILDVGRVTFGENVLLGPNVSIYTAGHPIHPESRNSGYEYGIPITIGDNVWVGGSTTILPGVTIGENTVIGAGSVVTKDIPPNVVAAGNPCRVIRPITEADRPYYFKDKKFDPEIWDKVMGGNGEN